MASSLLIAKLIGPLLVLLGLTTLFNPKVLQEVGRDFLASPALIFIGGVMALLAGLAIVATHNFWVAGWPVIITLFGWLAVLGGILRIGFPTLTKRIGRAMLAKTTLLRASAAIQVVLGGYLMIMGYL